MSKTDDFLELGAVAARRFRINERVGHIGRWGGPRVLAKHRALALRGNLVGECQRCHRYKPGRAEKGGVFVCFDCVSPLEQRRLGEQA